MKKTILALSILASSLFALDLPFIIPCGKKLCNTFTENKIVPVKNDGFKVYSEEGIILTYCYANTADSVKVKMRCDKTLSVEHTNIVVGYLNMLRNDIPVTLIDRKLD